MHVRDRASGKLARVSEPVAGLSPEVQAVVDELSSLFFSEAAAVDAGEVPVTWHLDALARTGFYGAFAPVGLGGLGLTYEQLCGVVEQLSSSCLASTFVWAQHFRLLGAVLSPELPDVLRARLQPGVVRGAIKGGVALTGLMPGPARLQAAQAGGRWALNGDAPWVSGWGMVDKIFVVARAPGDSVVSVLLDAESQRGLTAHPVRLSAADATRTVRLHFEDLSVPEGAVVGLEPWAQAIERGERLRLNGSFALGVVRRCTELMGPSPLDQELAAARRRLDTASGAEIHAARAGACELAVRAAHALAVQRGSRSAQAGDVAERLSREAAVLLVFGTRPPIKQALLEGFGAAVPAEPPGSGRPGGQQRQ